MSIRVSDKHGVNPSIPSCFYCNEQKSEIVLWNSSRTHVKWGRFASGKRPGEVGDMVKLQNLLTVVKREGPDLPGIDYVDVRWNNPYVMRRSNLARARSTSY